MPWRGRLSEAGGFEVRRRCWGGGVHLCLRMANRMPERPIVLSEGQVKANDERPSDEPVVSVVMLVDTIRENAQVVLDTLDGQTCDSGVK